MMEEQKSKINIQWFPGHMTKAKRQMEEHLKLVDMVIELRDARIPNASKNPLIEQLTKQKPRLILLTKRDKAQPEATRRWVEHLQNEQVKVLALDLLKDPLEKRITSAAKELMKDKLERMKRRGIRPRAIRAMVVGIPTSLPASMNSRAPAMESWSTMPAVHNPSIRAANTAAVGE